MGEGRNEVVVIGAGPAGLSAAYELAREGRPPVVLERETVVGGLSRTVARRGFRFDIGGHRFFTRSPYVNRLWHDLMPEGLLRRPRVSRIFYGGRMYDYPLRLGNALKNLGAGGALAALASLLRSRLAPIRPERTFSDWVSNRFGRRLFEMFFRSYTEKVWGVSCDKLSADWAAQRIRGVSLGRAIARAMGVGRRRTVASLIEEFDYPRRGAGQMYEAMAAAAREHGARILVGRRATRVEHAEGLVCAVRAECAEGPARFDATGGCFSSMPLDELVLALDPPAPAEIADAARRLHYRSLLTVNLILDGPETLPDTWIYLHDPAVRACRVQLCRNWSDEMSPDPRNRPLSLEYFCTEGDELWNLSDAALAELAAADLKASGLARGQTVADSFVIRSAKSYPVYDEGYRPRVESIRRRLAGLRNLYAIGRYGQFRYNNMDHSILTAHYAAQALVGRGGADPWSVNADADYQEEGPAVGDGDRASE